MKILHPPLKGLLTPIPQLSLGFDSSSELRVLFQRLAYSGFEPIARAQCGSQPVVRDLVWLLHLKLNGLDYALCALHSSLWDRAFLKAISDVPMYLLIMFYRIQINWMFSSKILLLQ